MTHPDPAPGVNVPLLAAPCGCTYKGRFYSTSACTTLDQDTATGRQRVWHAMAAQAFAEPVEREELPMPQPTTDTTRWFDDPDQVLAFGGLLVAAGEFDTAQSLLDYIEKPWKWDRERDQWIAHGRPNAEDNPEQWQAFVELLA